MDIFFDEKDRDNHFSVLCVRNGDGTWKWSVRHIYKTDIVKEDSGVANSEYEAKVAAMESTGYNYTIKRNIC